MHPVRVSNEACFTVRYSTKPDKIGTQPMELSHQGKEYILRNGDTEYKGSATPGKDVEAMLLWDNDKNQYVLHFVQDNLKVSRVLKRPTNLAGSKGSGSAAAVSSKGSGKKPPAIALPSANPADTPAKDTDDESSASDADDFGDFANELEGELGSLDSATIIGTAGTGGDDEEISSEEE